MTQFQLFISPLILSSIAAFVLTPLIAFIYYSYGVLDDPQKQSHAKIIHRYPVPRGGGVVIFLTLFISGLIFLAVDKFTAVILFSSFILMLTGIADDLYNIHPYFRLAIGLCVAALVVLSGINISFITNPLTGGVIDLTWPNLEFNFINGNYNLWVLADILGVLWILWTMNMVNWSKGLDGQLPGIVVIAALTICVLSLRYTEDATQWSVTILSAITAGAYLGFLPWNMYPQKIMPGYGGGSLAGFLLAVTAIMSGAKLATMVIVLGVPMMDALYTIIRRILSGKSPVWGDRGHLHHKLLDLGMKKSQVALFYWTTTALLGFIVLQLNSRQKAFTIVLLLFLVGGLLLWLNYFINSSKRSGQDNG